MRPGPASHQDNYLLPQQPAAGTGTNSTVKQAAAVSAAAGARGPPAPSPLPRAAMIHRLLSAAERLDLPAARSPRDLYLQGSQQMGPPLLSNTHTAHTHRTSPEAHAQRC